MGREQSLEGKNCSLFLKYRLSDYDSLRRVVQQTFCLVFASVPQNSELQDGEIRDLLRTFFGAKSARQSIDFLKFVR